MNVKDLAGLTVQRVIRIPAGYLALAFGTGPGLYISHDGLTWRRVVGPADGGLGTYESIAFAGERAILVGTIRLGTEGVSAAWSGPASVFVP
jgi:hypothetical protein